MGTFRRVQTIDDACEWERGLRQNLFVSVFFQSLADAHPLGLYYRGLGPTLLCSILPRKLRKLALCARSLGMSVNPTTPHRISVLNTRCNLI